MMPKKLKFTFGDEVFLKKDLKKEQRQKYKKYKAEKKLRNDLKKTRKELKKIIKNINNKPVLCFNGILIRSGCDASLYHDMNDRIFSSNKQYDIGAHIESKLMADAKFRPPISKERKRKMETCSSKEVNPDDFELPFLKVKRVSSITSESISETSDHPEVMDVSEDFINLKTETIPGLDLINESQKEEAEYDMVTINPCLGKKMKDFCKKKISCFKKMIQSDSIHAKYKCMGNFCSFVTSNKEFFHKHLKAHKNDQNLSPDYFLNCCYCFAKFEDASNLVNHHETSHAYCRFQCSDCFYRSAVQMSVYDHQRQFHSEKAKIIECTEIPLLDDSNVDINSYQRKLKDKIEKVFCNACCMGFNNYQLCLDHHESHENCDELQKKLIKLQKDQFVSQKIKNQIGRYVCLFCPKIKYFATDRGKELRSHMQNHPMNGHYCCDLNSNNEIIILKPRGDLNNFTIKIKSEVNNEENVYNTRDS